MRHLTIRSSSLLLGIALLAGTSCSRNSEVALSLGNPSEKSREDASVRLTRGEIAQWVKIPADKSPYLKDESGKALPCQADDVNGDGTWDEIFAQLDLAPGEQKRIYLDFIIAENYPVFPRKTNIRLGDATSGGYPDLENADRLEVVSYHNYSGITESHYQMEGVAWENDRVGFRNYLDQRNGTDIFGKLSRELVLDGVGVKGKPSYHEPAAWGMDILKVGTSLGAGSLAYLYKDSLYRLGDNGPGDFKLVFEGSQRSRFALNYPQWKVGDKSCQVNQLIEIVGGRHFYQGTVTNSCDSMDLAVGLVNIKSDSLHLLKAGEHHMALYTLDQQAEDGSMLAMALVIPTESFIRWGQCPDSGEGITSTYYALLDASSGTPLSYRFYALWEKENPNWANEAKVKQYLVEEGLRWTQSVVMEVHK